MTQKGTDPKINYMERVHENNIYPKSKYMGRVHEKERYTPKN